jgi:hypothetical protein
MSTTTVGVPGTTSNSVQAKPPLINQWQEIGKIQHNIHVVGHIKISDVERDLRELLRRAETKEDIQAAIFGKD